MKLILGSDHAGFSLKKYILGVLQSRKIEVVDCGCFSDSEPVDYPDIAFFTCRQVVQQKVMGILFCGTGIGMAIAANKVEGVRAVCGFDCFSVKMARQHNDANVLCLGGRVIGQGPAIMLVDFFLNSEFESGRHKMRIDKLKLRRGF